MERGCSLEIVLMVQVRYSTVQYGTVRYGQYNYRADLLSI